MLLGLAQLRIEEALAQAEGGEHNAIRPKMLEHPIEDQSRGPQHGRAALGNTGHLGQFCRREPQKQLREIASLLRGERMAVHDPDRRFDCRQISFGDRTPVSPDRIKDRLSQRWGQAFPKDRVNTALGSRKAFGKHRLDGQGAERRAEAALADMIIERLGNFEALVFHIADQSQRPKEA